MCELPLRCVKWTLTHCCKNWKIDKKRLKDGPSLAPQQLNGQTQIIVNGRCEVSSPQRHNGCCFQLWKRECITEKHEKQQRATVEKWSCRHSLSWDQSFIFGQRSSPSLALRARNASPALPPSPCSTSALCPRRRPSGRFVSSSDKSSHAGGVGEFLQL